MWPLVHDMLSAILAPEHARAANPLVRRAALGLLRICRRLLHYQTDSAQALLKSMQMILRLDPAVAWDLAPAIAKEVGSTYSNRQYIVFSRGIACMLQTDRLAVLLLKVVR